MTDPIFDKEALLEEIDGDWEFLEESVAMLEEDAGELVEKLRNGVAADDAEATWQCAHTIKSMVGNFAAKATFDLALRIEQRGRSGDLDDIAAEVDTLGTELEKLTSSLNALLSAARD